MFAPRPSRFLKLALAAMFVWLQAASFSHAAVYGDGEHEHDGVTCEAGVLVSEDLAILPDTFLPEFVPAPQKVTTVPCVQTASWQWPPERGPPPRSPPAFNQ